MKNREAWHPAGPGAAKSQTERLNNNNINLYFFRNHFLVLLHFSFHFKISAIYILSDHLGGLFFLIYSFFDCAESSLMHWL